MCNCKEGAGQRELTQIERGDISRILYAYQRAPTMSAAYERRLELYEYINNLLNEERAK
uniref:Uncharacterized protein n=1 Tax=viral metagenome TaxID=1070528 RepID=A0A6M3LMN2_9ZZZZ